MRRRQRSACRLHRAGWSPPFPGRSRRPPAGRYGAAPVHRGTYGACSPRIACGEKRGSSGVGAAWKPPAVVRYERGCSVEVASCSIFLYNNLIIRARSPVGNIDEAGRLSWGLRRVPRILAIDLGEVRMGLAVSDDLMITAQPLPTWRRMGRRSDFAHLGDLVEKWGVHQVVVGYPRHLGGEVGEQAA